MMSFASFFVGGWIVALAAGLVIARWFVWRERRSGGHGTDEKRTGTPIELRAALLAASATALEDGQPVLSAPVFLLGALGYPRVASALQAQGVAIGALRERLRRELAPRGEVPPGQWKYDAELVAAMHANQPYAIHQGDPLFGWAATLLEARGVRLDRNTPRVVEGVFVRIANDEKTTMEFVTNVLEEELSVPREAARFLMYAVHLGALGQVQVMSREDAETAKARIEARARAAGYPLRVDVFESSDEPGGWERAVPA